MSKTYHFFNSQTNKMKQGVEADDKKYLRCADLFPKAIKKAKGDYLCDECGKAFKPQDTLIEKDNLWDGFIKNNPKTELRYFRKGDGDTYYLVSPCCHKMHRWGFDYASKDEPYVEDVSKIVTPF